MKLLAGFTALCFVLAGLLLWQYVPVGPSQVTPPKGRGHVELFPHKGETKAVNEQRSQGWDNARSAASDGPVAAPAPDAGSTVERTEEVESSVVARTEPARRAPAAVKWAHERGASAARPRLIAAEAALQDDPSHPTALRDALVALIDLERWSEAADVAGRVVAQAPDDENMRRTQAEMLVRAGRWTSALDPLRSCVKARPDDVEAHVWLAAAHTALGHLAAAERAWSEVITLAPEMVDAHVYRGQVRLSLERWGAAGHDFEEALTLDAEHVAATLGVAEAWSRTGRTADAAERLYALLERFPRHVRSMNALARLAWIEARRDPARRGTRLEAAIAWCERSLEVDPAQPDVRRLLEAVRAEKTE